MQIMVTASMLIGDLSEPGYISVSHRPNDICDGERFIFDPKKLGVLVANMLAIFCAIIFGFIFSISRTKT
jgi:hypothetical protein